MVCVKKLLNIRKKGKSSNKIRKRPANKLNFHAEKISELCSWARAVEPAVTLDKTDDEIKAFSNIPLKLSVPCHSQAVEREVKLTTEASTAVAGVENQQGYAFNVKIAREHIP